jgi:hypothetical protein
MTESMVQVVEHFPSMYKTLGLIPNTKGEKKEINRKRNFRNYTNTWILNNTL